MRLSVIGWPIEHSLSPAMHAAALSQLAANEPSFASWRYEREVVAPDDLASFVARARRDASRAGFNVTLPHKVTIAALLDRLAPSAERVGAVNTVIRRGDLLEGHNTDAEGLMRSLDEAGVDVRGDAIVVGAGGAARAAVVGLLDRGARSVHVAARDVDKARALVASGMGSLGPISVGALTAQALAERAPSLLVQASTASMDAGAAEVLATLVPLGAWRDRGLRPAVVDLVYRPRITALLSRAAELGLPTVDGVGMLVHQGALALEAWTGRPVDVAVMRAAVLAALA